MNADGAPPKALTYRDAGVDIDAADAVVSRIGAMAAATRNDNVPRGFGHFGGFYTIGPAEAGATLVASIDGVGTKIKVATLSGLHQHIGADLVNHCVNDIAACGAEPLFFLDYYGTGRLDPDVALAVVNGLARACEEQGIVLLGGETAEMPSVYAEGDYDLVGAIVGMVQAADIVDGTQIAVGDVLLGLPSSGPHTNGYSLIRAILELDDSASARDRLQAPAPWDPQQSMAAALVVPHRTYLPAIRALRETVTIKGMAHITGGGLPGNVARIVPDGLVAAINLDSWTVPSLFRYIVERGNVERFEQYRTLNMGVGFVFVVDPTDVDTALATLPEAWVLGEVRHSATDSKVTLEGGNGNQG